MEFRFWTTEDCPRTNGLAVPEGAASLRKVLMALETKEKQMPFQPRTRFCGANISLNLYRATGYTDHRNFVNGNAPEGVPILCQEVPKFSPFSFKALTSAITADRTRFEDAARTGREAHKKKGSPG
jgi:hypothetical protein